MHSSLVATAIGFQMSQHNNIIKKISSVLLDRIYDSGLVGLPSRMHGFEPLGRCVHCMRTHTGNACINNNIFIWFSLHCAPP